MLLQTSDSWHLRSLRIVPPLAHAQLRDEAVPYNLQTFLCLHVFGHAIPPPDTAFTFLCLPKRQHPPGRPK